MPGRFCCGDGGEDGPAVGGAAYMWCVTGDWAAYGCVGLVYTALTCIDVTVSWFCIKPMFGLETMKGQLHMLGFQSIVFMVVYCHLSAAWSDPGLVAKDPSGTFQHLHKMELDHAKELEALGDGGAALKLAKKRFCNKCKSFKPKGAHHCSLCGRCVRKMDHHCPWINNCVGERNWKAFFLFLCYVAVGTLYAIVLYIMRAHSIVTSTKPADRASPYSKNVLIFIVVMCMVSFIFACAFLAFVLCMFYDQYEALTTGVPGVDAMQTSGDLPRVQSCYRGFRSMVVANEPFSIRWFLPWAPNTLRRTAPPLPPLEVNPAKDADLDKWEAHFDQLGFKPAEAPGNVRENTIEVAEVAPVAKEENTTFAGRNLMEDGRALMDEAEQMLVDAMREEDQADHLEPQREDPQGHAKTE